ncbi:hypothetical protein B0H17DRAFT_1215798 [Mycena rosella]|uniref:Uncharacterized protein n=1 Tax=Mycena rosella TaxID=1033263 RepID=A0AAD7CD98_MYCRO|nr:hypothetical protein B0H17DRAFT_1215798 [Mycena rosella]
MTLSSALSSLQVPSDFNRYDDIPEPAVIARLDQWKNTAFRTLEELQTRVREEQATLTLKEQGDIVSATLVFDGDDTWVTPDSRCVAQEILRGFSDPPLPLVVQMLEHNVKPRFRSNPHPSLNLQTGRKLARPAGGPMASQDFYDNQAWKENPGASNIVLWCVLQIPSAAYEELWHLVIPPIMALLDDYEARYKLKGVRITSAMLERVPSSVLKRTGVDSLLSASLSRSLTQLQSPETPHLLPAAISTSLSLVQLMTSVGSADRFDQLCVLLGDGIIGSIWPYSSDRLEALLASIEALPPLVEVLGVGCARYLKVLIAQLVHPLAPREYEKTSVPLQIASLRALSAIIDACPERMAQWKGTILNGVGRCWVTVIDSKADTRLKRELGHVCQRLAIACPSVLQEEYPRFQAADAVSFEDLLGPPSNSVRPPSMRNTD